METKKKITSKREETPIESLTYEMALEQLEEIINQLELGEQTLDQSIALYEKGQLLANRCSYLLEQAELKIQLLSDGGLTDYNPEK